VSRDPRPVAYWRTPEHLRPRTPRQRPRTLEPLQQEIGRMLARSPYAAAPGVQRLHAPGFDGGSSLVTA
jgi:hypothetical protein